MPNNRACPHAAAPAAPAQPRSSRATACVMLLCGLCTALAAPRVSAEELSREEMVCVLDPQCAKPFKNIGVTATTSVRTPGSFDNHSINFEFGSARLTADARKELDKVAAALTDPSIAKYTIIIHGHTDGVGNAQYNQVLSEQRAQAAQQYFITQYGINPNRLVAKGHGKSQLLLPEAPTNERNRRVQFENPQYVQALPAPQPAPSPAAPSVRPVPAPTTPNSDGL
jgi:outer membrane protein OmpA-like peptidoglycan-associated protein